MDLDFFRVAIALVFIWVGINLWLNFTNNFFYSTCGLSSTNTWHSLVVAGIITLLFWIYLATIPPSSRDEIEDRFNQN